MRSITPIAMEPLELISLNLLLKLKNHISYKYYLKKSETIKKNLENRVDTSIENLSEIQILPEDSKNREKITDCKYELYKLKNYDIRLYNKNIIQKIHESKNYFKSLSKLENKLEVVENSINEINGSSKLNELNAIKDYLILLYLELNNSKSSKLSETFENKHSKTTTFQLYKKDNLENLEKNKIHYFKSIEKKLNNNPIMYGIKGEITDRRHKIKNKGFKLKYKKGPIRVECRYTGKLLNFDNLRIKKRPNIICYVADEITNSVKKFINEFENRSKFISAYSLSEKKLHYSNHINSDVYARYFEPLAKTLNIGEILNYSIRGVKNV